MKHKHHIIPKHVGGTDEPSNLIELTPAEHAEAHRILYEEYSRWQDYVAWQGLLKLDKKFDAAKESMIHGAKKGNKNSNDQWKNPELKFKRVEKFKKSMEGKWAGLGRKGSLNPAAKDYVIIHPDGTEENVTALKTWCELRNLNYNSFYNQCVGRKKSHQGFIVKKV
jgi:hypothetical protein